MDRFRWNGARRRRAPGLTPRAGDIARLLFLAWVASALLSSRALADAGSGAPAGGALPADLSGRVLDPDGEAVAWATVEVHYPDGVRGPTTLTREDGSFRVRVAAEGALRVHRLGYRHWGRLFTAADASSPLEITLEPMPHAIPEVEVTALRRPGASGDLSVPLERIGASKLREGSAVPTIADRARETPEVSTIGRDEYNAAPAIRGLARFRTVIFLDGARIQSDREIGPTAGFVDPATLANLEVVRGPGSVLYGSDAIGGVMLLESEDVTSGAWAEIGWSSVNQSFRTATAGAVPLGDARLSISGAFTDAGDYTLPASAQPGGSDLTRAPNSGFERATGRARLAWGDLEGTAFYSLGRNIGRPAREPEVFSVPREEHLLATLRWRPTFGENRYEARGYAHPVAWEAQVLEPADDGGQSEQQRTYRSVDWGGLFTRAVARERASWVAGLQADARSDVVIHRRRIDRDATGAVTLDRLDRWVDGASVGQAGLFAHGVLRSGAARWNAGARIDGTWREGSDRDVRRIVPTGQAGVSVDVGSGVLVMGNVATAFREPTVTELFFSGRRPAGYIEGNPDLRPERSYQADLGTKATFGLLAARASLFGIALDEYIGTRLRSAGAGGDPDTLIFDNTSHGLLAGGSVELGTARPYRGFTGRVFVDLTRGWDEDGAPLADAPPTRGRLELGWSRSAASASLAWRVALDHERVGEGERPIPGYGVLDLRASAVLGPVTLGASVENVLDQEYYERPDPVAFPSPGRAIGVTVRWMER
ncbi:MAG TPA: TonB-dependent receptor [Candidatus Eisenbacteria bacterium]|nr:TonB-dependent receptor [Candidatus Eisenbacteria bacterium]